MVFESLVANLLNKYLSEFVDELTAKQLNLFAWNGNISLDNIAIKANAFDSLSLPFRVTHGHISRIEASFPWKSLYSSPVVIKLSDVYVVAVPNSETKYDDIKEELIEWNNKRKQLEKIEDAKQRSKDSNSEDKKEDDSFAAKLAAQIVKNLQVFITNVHICYEDQISWPNNPFQVGLTLHKLVFETQTDDQKKGSNDNIIYKLVTLEGLSFYWNCNQTDLLSKLDEKSIDEILSDRIANRNKTPTDLQYILWPINFTTNAVIDRKPEEDEYNIPVLDIQMDLDVFELRMTRMQFESLLLLLDAIDRMNLGQPYRKWRPSIPIKGNSKKWWRFAFNSIMETDIKRRSNNWSWNVIKEHRFKMNRYQELYKQKLLSKNIDSIKSEIERLEKDLNLFSIVLARNQAEVETQNILNKKEESKKGWFSGWFSKEENKIEENIVNDFKKEMNQKEKQRLYEAIGYEEGIPAEFPKDFIAYKIKFIINKLFVTISDSQNEKITQLSLLGVNMFLTHRPTSQCLSVSNSVKSLYISGVGGIPLLEETGAMDVLSLEFDMNPLDGQYDYGVIMRMSGFKLIYDANTINTIVEMLSPPKDISLEDLQSIAAFKFQDWSNKTSTSLEYAIGKHKQIKLNIDIEPSYVIIPQLGRLETANNILLLSLGHVKLNSKLIPKTEIPRVRDLISSHTDYELIKKMRKLAYESYQCHISEVQMILSDIEHWQNDIKSLSTTRHLLYPVEFNLTIERSIIPNDPHLPKIKVEGQLPNIEIKITDKQLTNLMNLLITLPFGKTDEEVKDEETDGSKRSKATPRSIPTIESSKMMSAAIDLVKETVNQMEESKDLKEESDGEKPIIAYKSVIFEFKLKQILVSLFQGQNKSSDSGVAVAKLDKFEIYGEVLTDSTLTVNCQIGDLCLNDVRTSRSTTGIKTLFEKNQLIPTSSDSEQKDSFFSILFTQKSNERLIEISISGFRLILALDYLLNLSNIITKAFEIDSDTETIVPKKTIKLTDKQMLDDMSKAVEKAKQLSASVEKSEVTNILHFNLSQMEIVLLESIEVINASAIIMSCHSTINLKQKSNFIQLYGEVSKISWLLTNYERYISSQEIDAYILRPTDLMINGTINGDNQMLDITFSEIQFFISPPMVNIVLNILSKMGSSAEKSDAIEDQDLNFYELFKIRPNDKKSWFLSYVPEAQEATEDFVDLNQKPVISTKQQIYVNIKSISFIIESGGLDSQPLIKLHSYFNGKLVGFKSLSANCSLIAEYYNENNFFWEPLIEPIEGKSNPWDFDIQVLLEENGKIDVKLESCEQLEVTISKTSIFVLSSLNEAFANAIAKQLPAREDNVVIVSNFLGIDLLLYLSNSSLKCRPISKTKIKSIENESILIKTGTEISLIANDLKDIELNIGLIVSEQNEILRRIKCHGHVIRCYNIPIKSYPSNEFWKWIVEVQDIDAFTKNITFKSNAQIVNQFNTSLDIFCLKRDKPIHLGRVKPLSNLELPMDSVYGENCELKVKPSVDYSFSDKTIDWRNTFQRKNSGKLCLPICEPAIEPLILVCPSENNPQNNFFVKVKCDNKEVLFEDTNTSNPESIFYQIRLIPIVKLRNLLPYRITYAIESIDKLLTLDSGEESDLWTIKLGETGLSMTLCNYLERDWHCFKKIPSHGGDNEFHLWKFTATSHERALSLDLAVKLSIENSSLIVSLFAPFWMINRTSQQLVYRIDDETVLYHAPTVMTPVLLSFKPKSFFCKKKLSLSIGDSRFSDGFSIDVVGSKGNIIAKSKNGKYNYYVSVDIQLSRIGLSKIVTITPFYSIINVSKKALEISEDNDEWFRVESMANKAFWPKQNKDQTIYFRFDSESLSSKPLSLSETSSTLIQIDKQYFYVDVDISEWDATIKLSDYFEGSAPVLLVNALNRPISYGQKGVTVWSSKTGEQLHVNSLPANHSILYTWYLPTAERKIVWKYEDFICDEQTVDLKCDTLLDVNNVFIVSFLEGKQRIVLFTNDYLLATNALQAGEITKPKINVEFIMKGIGLSIVNNEAKKDILYIAITSSVLWEIREPGAKRYKSLGVKSIDAIENSYQKVLLNKKVGQEMTVVSNDICQVDFTDCQSPKLIGPKNGQLRRLANRGIWISLAMSEHIVQCHIKVNRLQIDNQMPDHIFGIVMCPIAPPKTLAIETLAPKSFIETSIIIQIQPTINRFKYNSILIQEFLIQIDRGLLSSIQELLEVAVKKDSNSKMISKDIRDILQKNSISESLLSSRKSYYDFIHFSPLKVHVSFSLGGASGGLELPFGLDFLVRSAGVTLTEFNDVVFKLDYFERKNLLVENSELITIVSKHYTTQVLKQFYKLVLGLDLIGNPMKLALGLKEGVGDFFYEPFQGIIQGPEEFAEGLQIGVKSLASNIVGGAAGALGSITNTLGEGVSALTMDDKFRRERRARLNRKVGFAESGKNLFKGFLSGVTGVITQPMDGVREDGFEGLVKGVGKGVMGIVAQPTTGIIDFASNTFQNVKRAVDPNQEAKQMRPPRYVTPDGKLRPYHRHYAFGHTVLKEMENGKYSSDHYLIHRMLNKSTLIMLTDKRLMFIKKPLISNNWECDWFEEWTNFDKVFAVGDGLKLKITTKEQKKTFGIFSGDSNRIIAANSSETILWLLEKINKQLNQ